MLDLSLCLLALLLSLRFCLKDFTVSGYYSVYYYMQEQGFEHFRSICFFAIREKNQELGLPIWKKM
jgi:hypothetical protein